MLIAEYRFPDERCGPAGGVVLSTKAGCCQSHACY
jgi:hypothetical protein